MAKISNMSEYPEPKYPIPKLTFGLELELVFAARRTLYDAFLTAESESHTDIHSDESISQRLTPTTPLFSPKKPTQKATNPERQTEAYEALHSNPNPKFRGSLPHDSAEPSPTNTASTDSQSKDLRTKLLRYLLAFLNRSLPTSSKERSLIGTVLGGVDPKTATSESWHLTYDNSLEPHRSDLLEHLGLDFEEYKRVYRNVGAELVSAVLDFDDEEKWTSMVRQIDEDLTWDGDQGVWFSNETGLHVHFALDGKLLDRNIGILTTANLLSLYGLFEREIETWLPTKQRDGGGRRLTQGLRKGMRRKRLQKTMNGTGAFHIESGYMTYTPQEYTERLQAQRLRLEDLKTEATGILSPGTWADGTPRGNCSHQEWVVVNCSLARENKPTTIEYRQYQGTANAEEIKWWSTFCGHLLRYAHFLAQCEVRNEDGEDSAGGYSMVEQLTKKSVLDLIGFPEEGKKHFKAMANKWKDPWFEKWRVFEALVIQERIRRRARGQRSGPRMDNRIIADPWFARERGKIPKIRPLPGQGDGGNALVEGQGGGDGTLSAPPATSTLIQSARNKPTQTKPAKTQPKVADEDEEDDNIPAGLLSPEAMLHCLRRGEEEKLHHVMDKMDALLYTQWIVPSQGFTFKEMCEAYVLIAPEYQPVVEWLRAHPEEGQQGSHTTGKKKKWPAEIVEGEPPQKKAKSTRGGAGRGVRVRFRNWPQRR